MLIICYFCNPEMNYIEILPYAVAFILVAPFLIFLRKLVSLKEQELKLLSVDKISGNRIQAYERIMLLLERIKPANLVMRFDKGILVREFVFLIEKSISEEFDYNASMQLYLSKNLWQEVIFCRNETIALIHKTFENVGQNTTLEEYKTLFLMNYINSDDYISLVQDKLKKEALALR